MLNTKIAAHQGLMRQSPVMDLMVSAIVINPVTSLAIVVQTLSSTVLQV